jgi:hypothetical protein
LEVKIITVVGPAECQEEANEDKHSEYMDWYNWKIAWKNEEKSLKYSSWQQTLMYRIYNSFVTGCWLWRETSDPSFETNSNVIWLNTPIPNLT